MSRRLTPEQEAEFLRRENEDAIDYIHRIMALYQSYDPFNPNNCRFRSFIQLIDASNGRSYTQIVLPDTEFRSSSECQDYVPPFHLRDSDDVRISGYYTNLQAALNEAEIRKRYQRRLVLTNAYSNSVEEL